MMKIRFSKKNFPSNANKGKVICYNIHDSLNVSTLIFSVASHATQLYKHSK